MIKISVFIAIFTMALSSNVWADPQPNVSWVDGNIVFNSTYTPTSFEVALATSGIKWVNFTDFQKSRDEKQYLQDRLDDLAVSEAKKRQAAIDYLKSELSKK